MKVCTKNTFFFLGECAQHVQGYHGSIEPHKVYTRAKKEETRRCYPTTTVPGELEVDEIMLLRHFAAIHAANQLRLIVELVRVDIVRINRVIPLFLAR